MAKQKIDWVICGPDPYLAHCTRCGGREERPKLPMRIEAFIAFMNYVLEQHRYCVVFDKAELDHAKKELERRR